MPGYITEVKNDPTKPSIARATLRTPGRWDQLNEDEKRLWNYATHAISNLLDYYNTEETSG